MGAYSAIGWTDHTFNPWWGCAKRSAGCTNCYAEGVAARFSDDHLWGAAGSRRTMSDAYWRGPLAWNRRAERTGHAEFVFSGSMCDVFEDRDDLAPHRARLFAVIDATPHLVWMLLTKRPESLGHLIPVGWRPSNAWIGVTCEDQENADQRVPSLLDLSWPAVRFVSCEPLLGPVELRNDWMDSPSGVDWVIAGAESGPLARPMDEDWVRSLRHRCHTAGVPFFYKQRIAASGKKIVEPVLDGRRWTGRPKVWG